MIFLGLASNYSALDVLRHSFCVAGASSYRKLETALAQRYQSSLAQTSLIYSGRSALALALQSFLAAGQIQRGDHVAINAFTCYAVVEAVQFVKLKPSYVDLAPASPNFSLDLLERQLKNDPKLKVVIVQNSFGLPVDDRRLLKLQQRYHFLLIEDLAHCAGRFYPSGREIGTIGQATCLSFGKGKAIDTITGGAVILRGADVSFPASFNKANLVKRAKNGDVPRASWYPLFGAIARGLSYLRLEKIWLGILLKLRLITRSADTALDLGRTVDNWQAKLALRQLALLPKRPSRQANLLREFYLVSDRKACLAELRRHGFRLEELWYEVPIAPSRYYAAAHFPESECPQALFFAQHVVNLPTWYNKASKRKRVVAARKIIQRYQLKANNQG